MTLPARFLMAAALSGALLASSHEADAAALTVEVQGISQPGDLMVALYATPGAWLGQPLQGLRQPVAASGAMTVRFDGLPDGDYALSLFIDRDGNGRLDRNAMGVPTEPYAFSNDASGSFGPPTFDAARVAVHGDTRAVIHLP